MVKRKLATLTASLTVLIPASAFALGIGNISMNSALDQYLEAEISIQSASPEDLEDLKITMASEEMFAQYGIERPHFLEKIQFEVVQDNGKAYVRLTSIEPVREPFLNFLVEAKWPSGHALRQFTVLVDPPTMLEKVPVQVAPSQVSAPAPAPRTESRAQVPASTPIAPPVRTVPVSNGLDSHLSVDSATGAIEYGPSKANDTLWGVAKEMRGDRDVSIHQMMLAILRDNPDAFYRGNVNNLKMGYVLRIDDPTTITSISRAAAEREVARQYREWKSGKASPSAPKSSEPAEAGQAATASVQGAPKAISAEEEARLKLASAGESELGQGGGLAGGTGSALTAEQVLANQQETKELQERMVKLEEQIKTLQRLIELKDNQLASIQEGAKVEETPEPVAPAPVKPAAQPKPQPVPQPVVEEGILDNPMYQLIGLILLVLIVVGGLVAVKRRKQTGYQESILSQATAPASEMGPGGGMAAGAVAAGGAAAVAAAGGESSLLTDFSSTTMEGLQTDIGEIDPISEADVYLAYGRYPQAEEIIQDALKHDPAREEYNLKLLEIYHSSGEKDKFEEAAQDFHTATGGNISGNVWDKVCVMGHEMSLDNPLFEATAAPDAALTESNEALSEAESLEAEQGGYSTSDAEAPEVPVESSDEMDSFDFNTLNEVEDQTTEVIKESASEEGNVLEFDLGSFDELSGKSEENSEAKQQLDEEIAGNSLDFGADLGLGEEPSGEVTEVAEQEAEAADESELLTAEPEIDLDMGEEGGSEETGEEPGLNDIAFDSVLEGAADDLQSGESSESAASADDNFDFDTLEDLDSLGSSESEQPSGLDIESDLAEMANMLDQGAGEEKEDEIDLDTLDLGSLEDLTDDAGSDFDDDNPFADLDEVGTKLDLARAYVEMGDSEGAQSIIDEVMEEGNDEQKQQAQELLKQL